MHQALPSSVFFLLNDYLLELSKEFVHFEPFKLMRKIFLYLVQSK
jgi:hypothetical protein